MEMSSHLSGGSTAAYLEDQQLLIWRISDHLSGGSAAAFLRISGRLSGLNGNKTQDSQLGLWLSLAKWNQYLF
jgi:hypothetical protein